MTAPPRDKCIITEWRGQRGDEERPQKMLANALGGTMKFLALA